jgi:hypothetical protein
VPVIRMIMLVAVLALVATLNLAAPPEVEAQTTKTALEVQGLPNIVVSCDGTVAVCSNADVGNAGSKRIMIFGSQTTGGAPVHAALRIQKTGNGLFIDLVIDGTLAQLDTRFGSLNLSARSHPSPTEDAVDTAAILDAAD